MRFASSRSSILVGAVLAASMLLVVGASGASAAQPAKGDVHIVSDMFFPNDGTPNSGTFTASGDSVLCPSGEVLDLGIKFAGYQSNQKIQITVIKLFTCDNNSENTFVAKLQIHTLMADGSESFSWVVTGGTGDYAHLRGSGSGITTNASPDGNTNTYDGHLVS